LGYKELFSFLNGNCSLEEAVEQIKGHTRQYARRQLTWFRKDTTIQWFHPGEFDTILTFINNIMR
jgi:tRNA dimethylallyltransferase